MTHDSTFRKSWPGWRLAVFIAWLILTVRFWVEYEPSFISVAISVLLLIWALGDMVSLWIQGPAFASKPRRK